MTPRENLKEIMRKFALLPPPSIEKVRAQVAACAKWRKEHITTCEWHPEYKGDCPPEGDAADCHGCLEVFCAQSPEAARKFLNGETI